MDLLRCVTILQQFNQALVYLVLLAFKAHGLTKKLLIRSLVAWHCFFAEALFNLTGAFDCLVIAERLDGVHHNTHACLESDVAG